jgi:hypothetical protein
MIGGAAPEELREIHPIRFEKMFKLLNAQAIQNHPLPRTR